MANRAILYEKIYDYLKTEIVQGRFQPGDMIPTEQELMEKFNVSRMTTNRALQLLSIEGTIIRRAGVGTFVAEKVVPTITSPPQSEAFEPHLASPSPMSVTQIGFVIPFLSHSFGPILLAEVERELHACDMALGVGCSYGSQAQEEEAIMRLLAAGVEGLVLFPVNGEFYNPAILRLHVDHFPIVLVDKQLTGLPVSYVTSDNTDAAQRLTEHLITLGHTDIAFFSPDWQGTSTLSERRCGFEQALSKAGLTHRTAYDVPIIPWNDFREGFDRKQIEMIVNFLTDHPKVTAVFATDDELAEYWLEAARRANKQVPQDLSIVCFDGPAPKPIHWSFTCALQDQMLMAHEAVRIVRNQLDQRHQPSVPEAVTVSAKLHIGQSTGPVNKGVESATPHLIALGKE